MKYGCAFLNCDNLKDIRLPESLQFIGERSFYGCSKLSSITLPKGITNLGYNTFHGCTSLCYIVVKAESAFSIPYDCFDSDIYKTAILYVNKGLKESFSQMYAWSEFQTIVDDAAPDPDFSIEFQKDKINYKVTSLIQKTVDVVRGEEPYKGDIKVPASVSYKNQTFTVKSIVDGAFTWGWHVNFMSNDELTSLEIEDGIESIGESVCNGCSALKKLRLPRNLKKIPEYAFSGCPITSFTIPDNVEFIGRGAFTGCMAEKLVIPSSVKRIDRTAFYGSGIRNLIIKSSGDIENAAFENSRNLTSVSFEAPLQSLRKMAFANCTSLSSITLPEGLRVLDIDIFNGCTSLSEIYLPASLEQIHPFALRGCDNLQFIRVAEGSECYDSREDCNAVIDTKSNTLLIGCQNTTIPKGVSCIGDYAFSNCNQLSAICIPKGVQRIGHYAFENCKALAEIEFPETLTGLGWGALQGCSSLTSISIPASVRRLENYTFYGCENLAEVELPKELANIGWGAFSGCTSLKDIDIPANVTSIEGFAFRGCENLIHANLPEKLISIGYGAFENCTELNTVTIPSHVNRIERYAFSGCTHLTRINSHVTNPSEMELQLPIFEERTTRIAPLYVPKGTAENYSTTIGWKDFMRIIEVEETDESRSQTTSIEDYTSSSDVDVPVFIYRTDGTKILTTRMSDLQRTWRQLPSNGIYIIRAGKRTIKAKR